MEDNGEIIVNLRNNMTKEGKSGEKKKKVSS